MVRQKSEIADDPALAGITNPKKRMFLTIYAGCCSVIKTARRSKISKSSHYRWLDNDPAYARAFTIAKRQAVDILESVAIELATIGEKKYLYSKGKPVLDTNGEHACEYTRSVPMLICLLKANAPEKYRDNYNAPTAEGDGVRVAGRDRAEVIKEEIEARQRALDMIIQDKQRLGN